ncbi:hypothetical protein V2G26_004854 [Clonostachys chloroleuca]
MPFTVGDYLAERLAGMGICHHFIVPGDYNLILLDKLQQHPSLSEVGCTNELNCSLAAEGYARANGVAACVVTFSVGGFAAFNGVGSAYAENLPVILISGGPNTNDSGRHLLHHTLGEWSFTYQLEMARKITCCAVAITRADQAPAMIDRAIRMALLESKPAYIEIPTNIAGEECPRPGPITAITGRPLSDTTSLEASVAKAVEFLGASKKPVILVGPKVRGTVARLALIKLAEAIGCAVVLQPAAKGRFPEDHSQFAGIFWGQVSTFAADAIVNWADVLICIGTVFTDYSTVGWTAMSTVDKLEVDMSSVTVPGAPTFYSQVWLDDFLARLSETAPWNPTTMVEYNRIRLDPPYERASRGPDPLTRKEIARRSQKLVSPETTVFVDTGDSWFNGIHLRLPRGAGFEIEMQWGHIGWSVPAAFGYALAMPKRRVVIVVGDGAFQMTAQEVSQMVRWRLPIIILLMNNKGYTIEVEIHDGLYNRIQNWKYASLVQAFNGEEGGGRAISFEVSTVYQFIEAMDKAIVHVNGPTLIECTIDQDDCNRDLITWGHFVAAANSRPPETD